MFVGICRKIILPGILNGGAKWISSRHCTNHVEHLRRDFVTFPFAAVKESQETVSPGTTRVGFWLESFLSKLAKSKTRLFQQVGAGSIQAGVWEKTCVSEPSFRRTNRLRVFPRNSPRMLKGKSNRSPGYRKTSEFDPKTHILFGPNLTHRS